MSGTGHLAANGRFYKKDGKRNDITKQKVFLNKKNLFTLCYVHCIIKVIFRGTNIKCENLFLLKKIKALSFKRITEGCENCQHVG